MLGKLINHDGKDGIVQINNIAIIMSEIEVREATSFY